MGRRIRIDPSSRMPVEDDSTANARANVGIHDRKPEPGFLREGHSHLEGAALDADSPVETSARVEVVEPLSQGKAPERTPFVELFVRSNFSFLQGATAPEKLVFCARQLGFDAMGLCDLDGFYGSVRALEQCGREGVRLVLGCELTLDPEPGEDEPPFASVYIHVASHEGYANACRLLTESHKRYPKGHIHKRAVRSDDPLARNTFAGIPFERVLQHPEGLWATLRPSKALARAVARGGPEAQRAEARAERDVRRLARVFGDRTSLLAVRHLDGEDRARFTVLRALSNASGVPLVASNAPLYAIAEEKPVLDILHCIREGKTLDEAGRELLPNAEACLKSSSAMVRLFADLPQAIARARAIADACTFSLRELKYRFPCELDAPAFEGETANQALRRLTYQGARRRYGEDVPQYVQKQLDRELEIIAAIDVAPYFLSVQTIVEMARVRDILCQGRGSAANSAVCYALGITAVDPSRSNLLFERFLSVERREPPDIDVDFEHERREEVIQDIYRKYGRDRAAMVCEIISYRGKSALREVGKVFGFSLEQVDRLSTLVSWWDSVGSIERTRLVNAGFNPDDARIELVLRFAKAIQGTPRHLSIHVGGFVLSAEPLENVAPIEPATMADRTIIPWDKDDLDTLGFFKVDVLGLGMLTALRKALDMVAISDPRLRAESAIERLAKIPAEDEAVYDALCRADTVGVFQIESRAQMAMLPRLRPRVFYDLVVEVAIVRPGPIQGGMVHPYLRRRNAEEPATPPHPILAPILDRTLGVPLFQEQVMQIAIVGAGYTGGEADQLRRDMAAWRKNGRLERHRERLLQGFEQRGISREFGERLYAQIQGFGEYGFPESHAASFALLVYASSWIKTHHPAAFAAALVNSQPMGFYSPSTIMEDAQRHGVSLKPICVLESDWDCTLDPVSEVDEKNGFTKAPRIRIGLRQVKGLGEDAGRRIVQFRTMHARALLGERVVAEAPTMVAAISSILPANAQTLATPGRARELEQEFDSEFDEMEMPVCEQDAVVVRFDREFLHANALLAANGDVGAARMVGELSEVMAPPSPVPREIGSRILSSSSSIDSRECESVESDSKMTDAESGIWRSFSAASSHSDGSSDARKIEMAVLDGKPALPAVSELHFVATGAADAATRRLSIAELIDGAALTRKELEALAEAGALDALTATGRTREPSSARREALWDVRAPRDAGLFEGRARRYEGKTPEFRPLSRAEQLSLDYERTGLSIDDHPMKLLRQELSSDVRSAAQLQRAKHGQPITVAGMVICRQRPATASGVVFITMADETGFTNLILYARVFDEQRHVATTSNLLIAHGVVEREGEVVYVVARRLEPLRSPRSLPSMSRDFH